MKKSYDVAVFHGDGIGPEIMAPTLEILRQLSRGSPSYELVFTDAPAGAAHYAKTGESFPTGSLETAHKADAILLSAMGLPDVRYPDGTEISPQIDLRKQLGLFAGVRPVKVSSGQMTPLALPPGKEIDFVLIRESTEGLFFTQGAGEVTEDEARETLLITREISEKLFRFAFELAKTERLQGVARGGLPVSTRPMCSAPLHSSDRCLTLKPLAIPNCGQTMLMLMPLRFGWCRSLGNSMFW